MVPRRPNLLRAPPRRRGTSSVLVPTVPYARWTQIEPAKPRALKASTRANVLARAWHGCLDRVLLLLTWLEVRAHPLLTPFATTARHSDRSSSTSSTAPRQPSDGGQARRLEGHHSEPHRFCQRRHPAAA